ncbi:putative RNA-directed DNA polymerase from transposon BS [Trichonephila clavipes]|uniref:Putative RNA-directed DNA polymerase from transposon BS n=1 Tax=Trichonephila clavipes TaxID=2585209 RepID=A0A8X6SX57_TRICX|nr:putative RNA-directed DNA polymerase from transposon BS [Trichonephila clavipes]
MTGTLPPLLDSVVGGATPERRCLRVHMDPMLLCPGKGLVLPTPNVDRISQHIRFLLLALPNNEMTNKSPFAVHKALIGIGGEPKSVKRLRSGDLLIETNSAIQTKLFLLAKTFLNSPLIVTPHKTLNSCRGVISEPDLLTTSESEILEGFSDQGVIQLLQRVPKTSSSVLAVSTSSTQANLLMSTSSTAASISETRTPIPTSIPVPPSTVSRDQTSSSAPAKSQDIKENSKRKKRKNPVKTTNQPEIEIK